MANFSDQDLARVRDAQNARNAAIRQRVEAALTRKGFDSELSAALAKVSRGELIRNLRLSRFQLEGVRRDQLEARQTATEARNLLAPLTNVLNAIEPAPSQSSNGAIRAWNRIVDSVRRRSQVISQVDAFGQQALGTNFRAQGRTALGDDIEMIQTRLRQTASTPARLKHALKQPVSPQSEEPLETVVQRVRDELRTLSANGFPPRSQEIRALDKRIIAMREALIATNEALVATLGEHVSALDELVAGGNFPGPGEAGFDAALTASDPRSSEWDAWQKQFSSESEPFEVALVIFDADLTLVDRSRCTQATWKLFAEKYNAPVDEVMAFQPGRPVKAVLEHFQSYILSKDTSLAPEDAMKQAYDWYIDMDRNPPEDAEITIMPGAQELLDLLAANNVRIAVNTSADSQVWEMIIRRTGLRVPDNLIVVTADKVEAAGKRGKPHHDSVLMCAEEAGVPPYKAVMVGDAFSDIVSGMSGGTRTICLGTGEDKAIATKLDYDSLSSVALAKGVTWMPPRGEAIPVRYVADLTQLGTKFPAVAAGKEQTVVFDTGFQRQASRETTPEYRPLIDLSTISAHTNATEFVAASQGF